MNQNTNTGATLTFYRMPDDFDTDPRVIQVGTEALGLYAACGLWATRHLTDGRIPLHVAEEKGSPELVGLLVDAGLWDYLGSDGFQIRDYLATNPAAAVIEAQRSARAVRGRGGR